MSKMRLTDEQFSCLEKISISARDLIVKEEVKKSDQNFDKTTTILFFYTKALKTFDSIVLLAKYGRIEDSYTLLRSFLEMLFTTFWVETQGDRAFIRFSRFEKVSKLKQHEKSRSKTKFKRDEQEFDYGANREEAFERLKALNKWLEENEAGFDCKKQEELDGKGQWAGVSIYGMIEQLKKYQGLEDLKWYFDIPWSVANEYVHSNPVTVWDYLLEKEDSFIPKLDTSIQDGVEVASLSAEIMLTLMTNLNICFNLGKTKEIEDLRKEVLPLIGVSEKE